MSAHGYLRFARANARFLGFGFTMTFASSVGQTFFIGVFGPAVRAEFGLSHTSWSAIYMAGTLLSAAVLSWTGPQIDRLPLKRYTTLVCVALVVAAAFMAQVPSAAWLVLAIFLLRQTGQGLASHVGTTSMARYFDADRGKAVALAALGFAAGESLLPVAAVLGIAVLGWRASYGVAATLLALCLLPAVWWLLRHHDARHRDHLEHLARQSSGGSAGAGAGRATAAPSWSRAEVLRHGVFYLLLPAVLAPSFIGTALFFHHLELAAVKGWSATWITGNYWVYALGTVLASLAAGPLVDRITAVRVLPGFLVPMALGLLVLWGFERAVWALPYLFLFGLTSGIVFTAVTALWAEIYGVRHLGAIRSLVVSLSVLSSALGPLVMGVLMDVGVSIEAICGLFALYCVGATGLQMLGLRGLR
ncbi:MAG: MFS transporter [Proteobacteria bacterium]|nr:MFS transporter [Pseudomonadota bacterium]MCH8809876.1 MFS transporter [Pseudomonadota bacterium]